MNVGSLIVVTYCHWSSLRGRFRRATKMSPVFDTTLPRFNLATSLPPPSYSPSSPRLEVSRSELRWLHTRDQNLQTTIDFPTVVLFWSNNKCLSANECDWRLNLAIICYIYVYYFLLSLFKSLLVFPTYKKCLLLHDKLLYLSFREA